MAKIPRQLIVASAILICTLGFGVVGTQEVCAGCNGTHGTGLATGTGTECYIAEGDLYNQLYNIMLSIERSSCGDQSACNFQVYYTSACYQLGDGWARDGYGEFGCDYVQW